jgi:transposase
MSTSLLYQAFGLVGYRQVRQTFQGGRVTFKIEQPRKRLRCSQCGSDHVWAQGGTDRIFRTLPIGGKPVMIQFKVPRLLCWTCGQVRQVKFGFADPKKRYTRAFERYALDLSQRMTIQDVAAHLQVSWDTIKDIQARFSQASLRKAQAAQAPPDRHR